MTDIDQLITFFSHSFYKDLSTPDSIAKYFSPESHFSFAYNDTIQKAAGLQDIVSLYKRYGYADSIINVENLSHCELSKTEILITYSGHMVSKQDHADQKFFSHTIHLHTGQGIYIKNSLNHLVDCVALHYEIAEEIVHPEVQKEVQKEIVPEAPAEAVRSTTREDDVQSPTPSPVSATTANEESVQLLQITQLNASPHGSRQKRDKKSAPSKKPRPSRTSSGSPSSKSQQTAAANSADTAPASPSEAANPDAQNTIIAQPSENASLSSSSHNQDKPPKSLSYANILRGKNAAAEPQHPKAATNPEPPKKLYNKKAASKQRAGPPTDQKAAPAEGAWSSKLRSGKNGAASVCQ